MCSNGFNGETFLICTLTVFPLGSTRLQREAGDERILLHSATKSLAQSVKISRNLSFEQGGGAENSEMSRSEYSQRTLPHPRRRDPDLRTLEPIRFTSPALETEKCDSCEILPPAPAQFADSSPEEMNKSTADNVVQVKLDMKMTRF